jgi:hypothetical protein
LVVSAHLAQHGVQRVVGPVPTRYARLWSEREGRRLSVVPWVSDDRALAGEMSAEHWGSYGALLGVVAVVPALLLTAALAGGISGMMLPVPFRISWAAAAVWVATVGLGAALATLAPAYRASRLPLRQALAYL